MLASELSKLLRNKATSKKSLRFALIDNNTQKRKKGTIIKGDMRKRRNGDWKLSTSR